ncbi:MAG: ABC transporter ATP-binding protein, partial [Actinobacteria bacterium]|nr:ABC transporter ATP-binding protein [Actinomycetota bacterium]
PRDEVSLTKLATARLGKDVIDVEDMSFAYDGGASLFSDVTWRLAPGERVGIVGVNGAGKSTLLQLLAKELTPTAGRVKHGKTVVVASLSQDTAELDTISDLRVVEAVAQVRERVSVGDKELTASQLTERLGFSHDRAWTPVGELSGGERRRLQLMRILVGEPNVLLLDEPTNDLDTDTLANIEDLLDMWPGTLVVVSHDRYLLERVTDHQVALLGDGRVRGLPGGVEEYLALREGASDDASQPGRSRPSGGSRPAGSSLGSGTDAQASITDAAQQRSHRKEMQRLERQIEQLAKQIAVKEAELAELAGSSGDYERMAAVGDETARLRTRHDEYETRWLELLEELD